LLTFLKPAAGRCPRVTRATMAVIRPSANFVFFAQIGGTRISPNLNGHLSLFRVKRALVTRCRFPTEGENLTRATWREKNPGPAAGTD